MNKHKKNMNLTLEGQKKTALGFCRVKLKNDKPDIKSSKFLSNLYFCLPFNPIAMPEFNNHVTGMRVLKRETESKS